MNLPELCIRRPVMTTLVMGAFVIFGIFAYRLLPVNAASRASMVGSWECRSPRPPN